MPRDTQRKRELDRQRTEWRKKHRTLNGKIILYPDKPPEHVNARGSKVYNWFWKNILLQTDTQEIPAIISTIQKQIKAEGDTRKIRKFRTMIGMAEDAYQLKQLDDIKDYDTELQLGKQPVYNSENGIIYRDGAIFTSDFNEDESKILLRDMEGVIIDTLDGSSDDGGVMLHSSRFNRYKNWDYMQKS